MTPIFFSLLLAVAALVLALAGHRWVADRDFWPFAGLTVATSLTVPVVLWLALFLASVGHGPKGFWPMTAASALPTLAIGGVQYLVTANWSRTGRIVFALVASAVAIVLFYTALMLILIG